MAATTITMQKLTEYGKASTAALKTALTSALDATDGGLISWDERDDKILLLIENVNSSAAKTVTVKTGNGIQGTNDLEISIAALSYVILALESGRFKNVSGTNKGKVKLTGTADIKVAAFKLP